MGSVFSDVEEALNPGSTIKVAYTKVLTPNGTAVRRPNTKIYVNSLLFGNVWRYIKKETTWTSFSWVVKADPSTVFIPARLRTILSNQMVTEAGVYMENCKFVRMSLHGSLEVISKDAFGTFLDNLDDCYETLPWKNGSHAHWRYYGEDKFMQFAWTSMASLGSQVGRWWSPCPRVRPSAAFTLLSAALDTARNSRQT